MHSLITIFILYLTVSGSAELVNDDEDDNDMDQCSNIKCFGQGYECIDGHCYCADGYIPNHIHNKCIRCPGHRQKCFGYCCSDNSSVTLTCWQGVCQSCHDEEDNWICRQSLDNILLISSAQIAMATALVFGIIATFILLYKLCAVTTIRPLGPNFDSRLSIGSLQVYIDERLRDAPPRYSSRTPPSEPNVLPAFVHVNAGFIHDSSVPPPPYTPQKAEENPNNAVHI